MERTKIDNLSIALATEQFGLGNLAAKGHELVGKAISSVADRFAVKHNPSRRALFATAAGTGLALTGLPAALDRFGALGTVARAVSGESPLAVKTAEADERTPNWFVVVSSQEVPDNGVEGKQGYTVEVPGGHSALLYVGPAGYGGTNGITVIMEGQSQGEEEAGVFLINGGTPGATFNLWGSKSGGGNSLVIFTNPDGRDLLTDSEIVAALGEAGRQIDKQHEGFRKPFGVITGYNGEVDAQGLITNADLDQIVVSVGSLTTGANQPTTEGQSQSSNTGNTLGDCRPHMNPGEECDPSATVVAIGDTQSFVDGKWVKNHDDDANTGSITITQGRVKFPYGGDVLVTNDPETTAQNMRNNMMNVAGCVSVCSDVTIYRR